MVGAATFPYKNDTRGLLSTFSAFTAALAGSVFVTEPGPVITKLAATSVINGPAIEKSLSL